MLTVIKLTCVKYRLYNMRSTAYVHQRRQTSSLEFCHYTAENGNKASLITISILETLNLKLFNTYGLMKTLNIIPAKNVPIQYSILINSGKRLNDKDESA